MAQGLPHQERRLTQGGAGRAAATLFAFALFALMALITTGACDDPAVDDTPPTRAEPEPRRDDPSREVASAAEQHPRSPREFIDAVIDHHHGTIRGTLDHAVLELRTTPEAQPLQVLVSLPEKLRLDHPDGTIELLVEGDGWRGSANHPAERLAGSDLTTLEELRQHLRAILLSPLYRAKTVKRAGPGVYSLILPGGETWRLEIDEPSLRLIELRGPAGPVQFSEFLETGVTVLPAVVELPKLGVRHVAFLANDLLVLNPTLFMDVSIALPKTSIQPRDRQTTELPNPDEKPDRPVIQDIRGRMFLVNADPGTWLDRRNLLLRAGTMLDGKGQTDDGLPTYRLAEAGTDLLIPFRPDPSRGHRPFARGDDDEVWHVPRHRAVVVAPPAGTGWDEAIAQGRKVIAEFLDANALVADGDLLCIPFLAPERVPDEKTLAKLRLRLEQRVRPRD